MRNTGGDFFLWRKLHLESPEMRMHRALRLASYQRYPGCKIFGLVSSLAGGVRESYVCMGAELFCQSVSREEDAWRFPLNQRWDTWGVWVTWPFIMESFSTSSRNNCLGAQWKEFIGRRTLKQNKTHKKLGAKGGGNGGAEYTFCGISIVTGGTQHGLLWGIHGHAHKRNNDL